MDLTEQIADLSKHLGEILKAHRWSISTAESLTAGKVATAIAFTPGASKYFRGGVLAYTNDVKMRLLDVEGTLLLSQGAVDPEVAYQMAVGAEKHVGSHCVISTTGYADGEFAGLVYIGVLTPRGNRVQEFRFCDEEQFDREEVQELTVLNALTMLIDFLQA